MNIPRARSRLREKLCAKRRAARAAWLFCLIQPMKSLICGVAVAVDVVISSTAYLCSSERMA